MTDFKKKIEEAKKTILENVSSPEWKAAVKNSNALLNSSLDRLRRTSSVDEKILDKPVSH